MIWTIVFLVYSINKVLAHGGALDDEDHHHHDHTDMSTNNNATTSTSNYNHNSSQSLENAGLAWGLVMLSVFASVLGGAIPLFSKTKLGKYLGIGSYRFLSCTLGFSSGFLLFLALIGLLPEARESFGSTPNFPKSHLSLIICFIFLFPIFIGLLYDWIFEDCQSLSNNAKTTGEPETNEVGVASRNSSDRNVTKPLNSMNEMNESSSQLTIRDQDQNAAFKNIEQQEGLIIAIHNDETEQTRDQTYTEVEPQTKKLENMKQKDDLQKATLHICIALALHHVPESILLMTMVLSNAKVGALFAFGLITHKLPEGALISIPMFSATGNAWKSFAVSFVAGGLSQIIAAAIGYVLYLKYWNPAINGTMFAFVSGLLVFTTMNHILPRAFKLESNTAMVSRWIFAGIVAYLTSVVIFSYT